MIGDFEACVHVEMTPILQMFVQVVAFLEGCHNLDC